MNPSIQRTPTLLRPSQRPNGPSRRPASIAELAQRARDDLWDDKRELKVCLRSAERHRKAGKEYAKGGDLEAAFVEFAKAATLVLEKLPTHKDYLTVLTAEQRHNLGLNGQDILDSLSELKPALVERYERWVAAHPNAPEVDPNYQPRIHPSGEAQSRQRQSDFLRSQQDARQREQAGARRKQEQERMVAEELEAWKRQREEATRYDEGEGERAMQKGPVAVNADDDLGHREVPPPSMRWVAESSQSRREADYTFSRRPTMHVTNHYNEQKQEDRSTAAQDDHARREASQGQEDMKRQDEARQQFQQQQEEMRRREEDITRRRMEERRREQDSIARRQQEEVATRAMRHNINAEPSSSSYQEPQSSAVQMPTAVNSHRPPSLLDQYPTNDLIMPLESPSRYEGDSTDSETITDNQSAAWRHARASGRHKNQNVDNNKTPTRANIRSPLYPPPITTTSPPPLDGPIRYPQMSQHQKRQGYVPSLHSMFSPIMKPPGGPSSLLFDSGASHSQSSSNSQSLYASNLLPQPSAPVMHNQNYSYGMPSEQPYFHQLPPPPHQQIPPPPPLPQPPKPQYQQQHQPQYRGPSRPPPPIPQGHTPPTSPPPSAYNQLHHQRTESARIIKPSTSRTDPASRDLKSVSLPRECLPRFLSIAALNTSRNFETCGLLLGKDKVSKFVVTTLLIPKQHSTSDTCTMDEEELVLQFTEERSLITLGWIHTHPSQSCFMSSVDLHTHSGFQRMLPESFAVVCAPKSNPNFGIFRLTDPPGLQTILDCNVKEAFHPHPDVPIYTDADKGHVQMKDISLEIVDLR